MRTSKKGSLPEPRWAICTDQLDICSPTDAGAAGEAALTRAAGVLSASERHRLRHLLQEIDHLSEEELSQESALAPHLSELQAIDAKLQALRPGHTVTVLDVSLQFLQNTCG
eukprot:TRINITY_DN10819_c0_g1_i9.p1 TRINITY_DN10819_c0_g1~~TRINITY_DN10819_c0_g1_i9.p1  ORF type:complete len:112 (+),score=15.94 TRINITY_DN10819_c0_g1_i9:394-729(+)